MRTSGLNSTGMAPALAAAWLLAACGGETAMEPGDSDQDSTPEPIRVAAVEVTPDRAAIWFVGETTQLTATARDSAGGTIGDKTFTWSSSDTTVATVSAAGLVTAVAKGVADITAGVDEVMGSGRVDVLDAELAELWIAASFQTWWASTQEGSPAMGLAVAAEELTAPWGNFAMRQLSMEPRVAWPNEPTFQYAEFNEVPWFGMYAALSAVRDGMVVIEAGLGAGGPSHDRIARAIALGRFVQGLCHGWLGLMFDRAFVLGETVNANADSLGLVAYSDMFAAAVGYLEEAIAVADTSDFALPASWINGNALSSAGLARLAHSQLARWLPQVARTPAERDAVDWVQVAGHVDQGIQEDFTISGDGGNRWWHAMQWFGEQIDDVWARADYKTIGWTELGAGGGFDAWLAAPLSERTRFELDVPDRRITPGPPPHTAFESRGLDFGHWGSSTFPFERGTYHWSFYGHERYNPFVTSEGVGPIVYMTTEEMNLTKAEALLRLSGPSQDVADLINATRVSRGELPAALATESATALMDKLIYEKRIETFAACTGCAYFDRRGWGPLAPTGPEFHHGHVEGTPLHFPIPGKELEVLRMPIYTFGGVGNELAPLGTAPALGTPVPARLVYRSAGGLEAPAGVPAFPGR